MKSNKALWVIALVITLASAIYQYATGPTYPIRGNTALAKSHPFGVGSNTVKYKLARSHGGETDHEVKVTIADTTVTGVLTYKRYKTDDPWTDIPMKRDGEALKGFLPHQPPAGKLMYKLTITGGSETITIPKNQPVVIRFRGDVPAAVLIAHVIIIFAAMFVSTRAGLEALFNRPNIRTLAYWSAGILFVGGMILGTVVQKYAFGEFWTGVPFGYDLTDNKTLIAMLGWAAAVIACLKGRNPRSWVLGASILELIIFIIPHSVLGSELDYSKLPDVQK